MKEWIARLIAYLFLGSFCIAGPLLVIVALSTAAQRGALLIAGLEAEATVIGAQQSGSSRVTYAPVFQFTTSEGRSYTVSSDVYGKESTVRYGERIRVRYWPDHPESARIDAFAPLWTFPLVAGVVGAGFSVVPAIVLVAWLRRRANAAEPDKREAARLTADRVSLGFRRALGLLLTGAGGALVVFGSSQIMLPILGVLLAAAGVQVGQWVATGSRLSTVLGGVVITALAVIFGWVAFYGESQNFHGGMSIGGPEMALNSPAGPARILFGGASILLGIAALWTWKRAFRSR